jgi:hypothetical protein
MANISIENLSLTVSELLELAEESLFTDLSESELVAVTGGIIPWGPWLPNPSLIHRPHFPFFPRY